MSEKVGPRIRRLRLARRWSRPKLAEKSGVDQGTIYRIETGRQQPHPPTLSALEQALSRPSEGSDGQTTITLPGGGAGIEDHLSALIAHIKTLAADDRHKFIRAVTSLLAALEHTRPAAGSGAAENDDR